MEIINGIHNIRSEHHGNVITMGNFDGVHLGHQQILSTLQQRGEEMGVPSALITFEPQPREYFAGSEVPPRLTRLREKVQVLSDTGLDRLVLLPFNERTARTRPEWITDELFHQMLGAKHVIVGDDFRFGRDRSGNFEMIERVGQELGYSVGRMDTVEHLGDRVSSTRIRAALKAGDFAMATALLGHEYFIMGRVVYGRQLGRQLGVPTANIRLQRYKAALEGVYCVSVEGISVEGVSDDGNNNRPEPLNGIANIGVRPTVDGKEPLLEVHVFDYTGNLYNELLTIRFKRKLRDEQTFDGIDSLKVQIDKDIAEARDWFTTNA
ncbi:MAG: bifunctional riboflavin kinase/FAD synthetase [Pseudomonadales bacterium]|nr:bifunctional riboflavin kinase/FAD synthetase [Pseudomonadales bacterium]